MAKKILVVLTSHEKYPDMNRATGVWLGEAVHFVEKVGEAGFRGRLREPAGRLRADRSAQPSGSNLTLGTLFWRRR
jgi:hypothetical protein